MGSCDLPFTAVAPAGFSRDRRAASSANTLPTTPGTVWLASSPHAAASLRSFSHRFRIRVVHASSDCL